eukprot:TRINITY_DN11344_c0_g1_i1.p1 TRINITY_DN11344_c0_g1~~TRINITY_DN11344_c0_g1_i1.p1  ORF type:complete len:536 (+),score=121.49 TRINITY_DN11344_c0_g1_i1:116-1723(+)
MNLPRLDALAEEFLFCEGLIEKPLRLNQAERDRLSLQATKLKSIEHIVQFILCGNVSDAISRLREVAADIADDQKLLFLLHKQQFIELLRRERESEALEYCKQTFSPFSLNSFPEAYSEYKKALMCILYYRNQGESVPESVAADWSPTRLTELAEVVQSSLKAFWCVQDPSFSLLIKYLITTHNTQHIVLGLESPFQTDTQTKSLFSLQISQAPLARESAESTTELREQEVQALSQAVGISRQESIEAIRWANGSVQNALRNELTRMKIDQNNLLQLCIEYCRFRDLLSNERLRFASQKHKLDESVEQKMGQLSKLRKLNHEGNLSELFRSAQELEERSGSHSPAVLFQLRQIEARHCIETLQIERAIDIIRNDLTPLTLDDPALVPLLKETTLLLAFPSQLPSNDNNSLKENLLVEPLLTTLGKSIGLEEPKLIDLFKYLIRSHTEWFQKQQCEDIFEPMFQLKDLLNTDENKNLRTSSDTAPMQGTGNSNAPAVDEQAILKIIEFSALSRAEAITLLNQCEGSVDEVFALLFS